MKTNFSSDTDIEHMGWHSPKDNEEWWESGVGRKCHCYVMTGKNMSLSDIVKGQKCQTKSGWPLGRA